MKAWIESRLAIFIRRQGQRKNRIGIESKEESAARILAVAIRHMKKRFCTVVTSEHGEPSARIVMPLAPHEDLIVRFATSPTSNKARQIAATRRAVLVFNGTGAGVTAYCEAELVTDAAELRRWWRPLLSAYWPDGPQGNHVIVRCRPYAFEVFAPGAGVGPEPLGLVAGRIELSESGWRLCG